MTSTKWMVIVICFAALPAAIPAEKADQASPSETSRRTEYSITAMDRTLVPVVTETRETKVDATTTARTETILQPRAGGFVETGRVMSLSRQVSPNVTETKTEVLEIDRQGLARPSRQVSATVTKTGNTEQRKEVESRRSSSGDFVPAREITAETIRSADGSERTVRVEKERDPNGNFKTKAEVEESVTPQGQNEKVVVTKVRAQQHLEGTFGVVREETATVKTEGTSTHTETVVRTSRGSNLVVTGKILSTETRAADGTIQREIIEHGEPRYSSYGPTPTEPLAPRRRIIEREVRGADGTVRFQRDIYRRDVNGEWKAVSFSTYIER